MGKGALVHKDPTNQIMSLHRLVSSTYAASSRWTHTIIIAHILAYLQRKPAASQWLLRRFLVLVTGTLVYGKGDKLEAKREGLLEAGEERIFAPVATAVPGDTQPSAVPGQRRSSVGTAPIAMRATPGSLKVCCQSILQLKICVATLV